MVRLITDEMKRTQGHVIDGELGLDDKGRADDVECG